MHTSVLEGFNNRIKVIKRMAYSFRDSNSFFLKTKAAFPEKARGTKNFWKRREFRNSKNRFIA